MFLRSIAVFGIHGQNTALPTHQYMPMGIGKIVEHPSLILGDVVVVSGAPAGTGAVIDGF